MDMFLIFQDEDSYERFVFFSIFGLTMGKSMIRTLFFTSNLHFQSALGLPQAFQEKATCINENHSISDSRFT